MNELHIFKCWVRLKVNILLNIWKYVVHSWLKCLKFTFNIWSIVWYVFKQRWGISLEFINIGDHKSMTNGQTYCIYICHRYSFVFYLRLILQAICMCQLRVLYHPCFPLGLGEGTFIPSKSGMNISYIYQIKCHHLWHITNPCGQR